MNIPVEVRELTSEQKAWLAIAAGVPFTTQVDAHGKVTFTTEPCDVQIVDGQVRVFRHERRG